VKFSAISVAGTFHASEQLRAIRPAPEWPQQTPDQQTGFHVFRACQNSTPRITYTESVHGHLKLSSLFLEIQTGHDVRTMLHDATCRQIKSHFETWLAKKDASDILAQLQTI
jgi:hypothetical protein